MANKEKETEIKIDKLYKVMGIEEPEEQINEQKEQTNNKKANKKGTFKTKDVVFLVILTCTISLIMGNFMTYKMIQKKEKMDHYITSFVKNYNYIVNNYNGKINKEELLDDALKTIVDKLDKNSTYMKEDESEDINTSLEGTYKGVGIAVYTDKDKGIVVSTVYKNSPASKTGLKAGDIITKLNNDDYTDKTSNDLVNAVKKLKNKEFKLTYIRNNQEKEVKLKVSKIELPSVTSKTFQKENKKVGYIYVSSFAKNTPKQFKKELNKLEKEKIDSLIIDLRNNSGGYLSSADEMISNFLSSDHVIYQIKKDNHITKYYSNGKIDKNYKIIMLVNGNTASSSEVMTSALKEQSKATIIGVKTYGKGSVQEMHDLSNGDKYKITTKTWLTSKGKSIDGKGIKPDIEIGLQEKYLEEPTEENDNQLQTAIDEAIKSNK